MLITQYFYNNFTKNYKCKCKQLVVGRKRYLRWAQIRSGNKLSPKFCYEIIVKML